MKNEKGKVKKEKLVRASNTMRKALKTLERLRAKIDGDTPQPAGRGAVLKAYQKALKAVGEEKK